MNKVLKVLLVSLLSALSATAATTNLFGAGSTLSIESGYQNHYVVNGVARNEGAPYIGVGALKNVKTVDVYIGGTLLPDADQDQSHWFVGLGRELVEYKSFIARLDATAVRHQAGVEGIPNSTELNARLSVDNPYLTPYVRGVIDLNLNQNGWFAGVERVQKLPYGFVVTPSFEYGIVNDYTAINVKATCTRPFETPFGVVNPFASVGWYDNNFDFTRYNFATRQFNGDVVYSAGLKFNF